MVGLAMAAMAYMIEMSVLRSIQRRQGKSKPSEHALVDKSSGPDISP
jgi:hypothetical protein